MGKMFRTKGKVTVFTFLMVFALGIGPSLLPGTLGQTTYEEVSSATVDTVFTLAPVGYSSGNTLNFDLNNFDVTQINLSGDPDLQAWANDVITEANSGLMSGTLSIDVSGTSLPLQTNAVLPVSLNASTDGSSVDADISYSGSLYATSGFSGDNLSVADNPEGSGTIGFEDRQLEQQITSNSRGARNSGLFTKVSFAPSDEKKFKGTSKQWDVPGVGFRGLDISVNNWGTTPKKVKDLKNHELKTDFTDFEYDAVSRTVSLKQTLKLRKAKRNQTT